MGTRYEKAVWTAIAVALSLIALNPWIAPRITQAREGVVKVDLVRLKGVPVSIANRIPVQVEGYVQLSK